MSEEKIYLKFFEDQDLKKCVDRIRSLGGVTFLGVSQGFAVFESENSPVKFMDDLLAEGVKVSAGVVKTPFGIRGIAPVLIACHGCGGKFSFLKGFSRSGTQLCDACLAEQIEFQPEEERDGEEEEGEGPRRAVR